MYKLVAGGALLSGLLFGTILTFSALSFMGYKKVQVLDTSVPSPSSAKIVGYFLASGKLTATLSDGRVITSNTFKQTASGVTFTQGNEIFMESAK